MKIKQMPEDFIVKEMPSAKPIGQGDYIWCTLKKRNWDLLKLLKVIAEKLQVSRSRISYAGLKDKAAVTYQTISFFNIPVKKLRDLKIHDAELSDFDYNQRPIKLGELKGNQFSITVRDLENKYNKGFLENRVREIGKNGVLNLFDSQRFGARNVTHLVGKELIKGDIEGAVLLYLTKTNKKERDEARNARQFLAETGDFKAAMRLFPKSSKWEITLLNHLVINTGDYTGAIKKLPRTLQLMFIHAYQAYVWNSTALEYGKRFPEKNIKIPMAGYGTKLGNSEADKIIKKTLNKEKIKLENFRILGIPELSSSGSSRDLLVYPENIKWGLQKDELNKGKSKAIMEFSLPKGSYGTQVIKTVF